MAKSKDRVTKSKDRVTKSKDRVTKPKDRRASGSTWGGPGGLWAGPGGSGEGPRQISGPIFFLHFRGVNIMKLCQKFSLVLVRPKPVPHNFFDNILR